MGKIRVYDLSKKVNMHNKDLVDLLISKGFPIKSHSSSVEEAAAMKTIEVFRLSQRESAAIAASEAEAASKPAPKAPAPAHGPRPNEPRAVQTPSAPPARDKKPPFRPGQGKPAPPRDQKAAPPPGAHAPAAPPTGGPGPAKPRFDRHGKKKFFTYRDHGRHPKRGSKSAGVSTRTQTVVKVRGPMTVKELSSQMGIKGADIISYLMKDHNMMVTLNQTLEPEDAAIVAEQFGFEVALDVTDFEDSLIEEEDNEENMVEKPPVVTVLGHVDHGKTKLLDTVRHTDVAGGETGGITQHIGAYQVVHGGKSVTFIDTPGHEAFTSLRARGAQITDIAVLVVAVDDGVMPQTIEAINHAKAAEVPIIVAINKIDLPGTNAERVKQQLSEYDLVPEDWGGNTIFVPISAKYGTNINELLDMILLVAELEELKVDPARMAVCVVIESQMDKQVGPLAAVLVQKGTLKTGDYVVAGMVRGRIRSMENYKGDKISVAPPSTPVKIFGLTGVPPAGEKLYTVADEKTSKQIVSQRKLKAQAKELKVSSAKISMEDLFRQIQEGAIKEFNIVVKVDVQGSLEAIKHSIDQIAHEEVRVKLIHSGIGNVHESDIMLASASNAVVMGFRVDLDPGAKALAAEENVQVRLYDIIYKAVDDIKAALIGMLEPEYRDVLIGVAEVRQTFLSSTSGAIAGSNVIQGKIQVNAKAKLIREQQLVYEGRISSLRRFKDSVSEVSEGYDCGITLENFSDAKVGDTIEAYSVEEIRPNSL